MPREKFVPIFVHPETKMALELVMKDHHHIFNHDQAICYLLILNGTFVPHTTGKIPEPSRVFVPWLDKFLKEGEEVK